MCRELARVLVYSLLFSESDDEEAPQPDKFELQNTLRTLSAKLEDLNTCNDLISKHGHSLQRILSDLEQLADPADIASRLKAVNERATIFRITTNAMINVSPSQDFLFFSWSNLFTVIWHAMINVSRSQDLFIFSNRKKESSVLFNDALDTIYLRLYGVGHIPKRLVFLRQQGRKEVFYLTMHSTHFIYSYMASDIW